MAENGDELVLANLELDVVKNLEAATGCARKGLKHISNFQQRGGHGQDVKV
jgi:hypothetical protein